MENGTCSSGFMCAISCQFPKNVCIYILRIFFFIVLYLCFSGQQMFTLILAHSNNTNYGWWCRYGEKQKRTKKIEAIESVVVWFDGLTSNNQTQIQNARNKIK